MEDRPSKWCKPCNKFQTKKTKQNSKHLKWKQEARETRMTEPFKDSTGCQIVMPVLECHSTADKVLLASTHAFCQYPFHLLIDWTVLKDIKSRKRKKIHERNSSSHIHATTGSFTLAHTHTRTSTHTVITQSLSAMLKSIPLSPCRSVIWNESCNWNEMGRSSSV